MGGVSYDEDATEFIRGCLVSGLRQVTGTGTVVIKPERGRPNEQDPSQTLRNALSAASCGLQIQMQSGLSPRYGRIATSCMEVLLKEKKWDFGAFGSIQDAVKYVQKTLQKIVTKKIVVTPEQVPTVSVATTSATSPSIREEREVRAANEDNSEVGGKMDVDSTPSTDLDGGPEELEGGLEGGIEGGLEGELEGELLAGQFWANEFDCSAVPQS